MSQKAMTAMTANSPIVDFFILILFFSYCFFFFSFGIMGYLGYLGFMGFMGYLGFGGLLRSGSRRLRHLPCRKAAVSIHGNSQ
jgi:hypothetical protein